MIQLRSYATLSELLKSVFGINIPLPVFSFGLLVGFAFFGGGYILYLELKRKEKEGLLFPVKEKIIEGKPVSAFELILNAFIGFIIGFKLVAVFFNYTSFTNNPQEFIFSKQGNIVGGILGAALLAYLKYREKNKQKLAKPQQKFIDVYPHHRIGDFVSLAAISGILGAKIFSNFEEHDGWKNFIQDPLGNFFSGLTIYGGLIFGAAAIIYYAIRKKINILHLGDAFAPALILAYGIGRIGCQTAGDGDWGIFNSAYTTNQKGEIVAAQPADFLNSLNTYQGYYIEQFGNIENVPRKSFKAPSFIPRMLVAQNYAHNVNNDGIPLPACVGNWCAVIPAPVFPTPLYEVIMSFFIFLILWFLRKRIKIPGMILALYILLNGIERFFIEKMRINNMLSFLGIRATQAEFISFIFILSGLIFIFILWYRNKKSPAA